MLSKKIVILGVLVLFSFGCSVMESDKPKGLNTDIIFTDKEAYKPNDTITVDWTIVGTEVGDCIVLAQKGTAPDVKLMQKATDGNSSGTVSFQVGYKTTAKPLVARYFKGCEMTSDGQSAESGAFTYSN